MSERGYALTAAATGGAGLRSEIHVPFRTGATVRVRYQAGGGGSRGPSPASSAPPAATTEPRAQSPAPRPPEPRAGDFGVEGTPAPSASEAGAAPSRTAPAPSARAGSTGSAGDEFGP